MGITRQHKFEHRNKANSKFSKICKIILFVLGNSHEPMFFCSFVLLIEIEKLLSHNCSEHD